METAALRHKWRNITDLPGQSLLGILPRPLKHCILAKGAYRSLLEVDVLDKQVRKLVEGVHSGKGAQVLHHLHRIQGPLALALRNLQARVWSVTQSAE